MFRVYADVARWASLSPPGVVRGETRRAVRTVAEGMLDRRAAEATVAELERSWAEPGSGPPELAP